jgi:hypothetical protein
VLEHVCPMGLEGIVSKHRERPYRGGRSPHWIKEQKSGVASDAARQRWLMVIMRGHGTMLGAGACHGGAANRRQAAKLRPSPWFAPALGPFF